MVKPCCNKIRQPETHETVDEGALVVYVEPGRTLDINEYPLTNVVAANAVKEVNGEAVDATGDFALSNGKLTISEPGLYDVNVFVEFTNIQGNRSGYVGVRLIGDTGLSRRLWMFKGLQLKPELAGSLSLVVAVTQPVELSLVAMWDGEQLYPNADVTRIYAEVSAIRLSSLSGIQPIL